MMPHGFTEDELRGLMFAIEYGFVTVRPTEDPRRVYAGNVEYKTSNGWTIVVFNDCDEFDYVDSITAPDGRHIDPWDFEEDDDTPKMVDPASYWLKRYRPPQDKSMAIWGLP